MPQLPLPRHLRPQIAKRTLKSNPQPGLFARGDLGGMPHPLFARSLPDCRRNLLAAVVRVEDPGPSCSSHASRLPFVTHCVKAQFMAALGIVTAMNQRGMHVILDGTFEDASSDSTYFNEYMPIRRA
jgi:hypothetical protein